MGTGVRGFESCFKLYGWSHSKGKRNMNGFACSFGRESSISPKAGAEWNFNLSALSHGQITWFNIPIVCRPLYHNTYIHINLTTTQRYASVWR